MFEPPKVYISYSDEANQLLKGRKMDNLEKVAHTDLNVNMHFSRLTADTKCVGLARIGSEIVTTTLTEMSHTDLGPPLHSLVIVGNTHPLEDEILKLFNKLS